MKNSLRKSVKLGYNAIASLGSEEHTSELQSLTNLVCRLLLEKKKKYTNNCPFIFRFPHFVYVFIFHPLAIFDILLAHCLFLD